MLLIELPAYYQSLVREWKIKVDRITSEFGLDSRVEITNLEIVFGRLRIEYNLPLRHELITPDDMVAKLSILAETYRLLADSLASCGDCGEAGEVVITPEGLVRILCNKCSQ